MSVSTLDTSHGFRCQNFIPSSAIGSIRQRVDPARSYHFRGRRRIRFLRLQLSILGCSHIFGVVDEVSATLLVNRILTDLHDFPASIFASLLDTRHEFLAKNTSDFTPLQTESSKSNHKAKHVGLKASELRSMYNLCSA